jgi:hypothetical protein
MQQEMDTQSDFGRAYSPDTVSSSSSSTTNLGAQHRFRSTAQHRQHPYIIPRRKPSAQKPRRVSENLIPDLTGLIARCNPYPITGGTYGNIYKCIYHGPEGDVEVRADVTVLPRSLTWYSPAGCRQSDSTTILKC